MEHNPKEKIERTEAKINEIREIVNSLTEEEKKDPKIQALLDYYKPLLAE